MLFAVLMSRRERDLGDGKSQDRRNEIYCKFFLRSDEKNSFANR